MPLCCSQVWGNLSECVCEAAYHTQQVFPAHGDGFSGFLPALEAAEQVSGALSPPGGWGASALAQLTALALASVSHSPQQEVQNIFKAKHPMDTEITKAKVKVLLWTFPGSGHDRSPQRRLAASRLGEPSTSAGADARGSCFCWFFPQIIGFGSALLEEVDPNPANFVGAGIIHTRTTQVGCLLRLEPSLQAQVKPLEGAAELLLAVV